MSETLIENALHLPFSFNLMRKPIILHKSKIILSKKLRTLRSELTEGI